MGHDLCTQICTYKRADMYIQTYKDTLIHIYIYVHMHIYPHTYMHTHVHTHIYIYLYIYIYIYIYAHTYRDTYPRVQGPRPRFRVRGLGLVVKGCRVQGTWPRAQGFRCLGPGLGRRRWFRE